MPSKHLTKEKTLEQVFVHLKLIAVGHPLLGLTWYVSHSLMVHRRGISLIRRLFIQRKANCRYSTSYWCKCLCTCSENNKKATCYISRCFTLLYTNNIMTESLQDNHKQYSMHMLLILRACGTRIYFQHLALYKVIKQRLDISWKDSGWQN